MQRKKTSFLFFSFISGVDKARKYLLLNIFKYYCTEYCPVQANKSSTIPVFLF